MQDAAPHGVAVAMKDRTWVGMSATSLHSDQGFAFSEMTGVLADRRRGGEAIAMNRRLGFTDEGPCRWEN